MDKNFKNQSMTDVAYGYLLERDIKENAFEGMDKSSDEGYEFIDFDELFNIIADRAGISAKAFDASKAEFAELLANDNRFVRNSDNGWDLNRQNKSMVDVAYDYLLELQESAGEGEDISIDFQNLFDEVTRRLHLSATESIKKKGQFYTNLTLDGRFIILNNYKWDLRANRQFIESPGINEFYIESAEEEKESIDTEEHTEDELQELGVKDSKDDDEASDSDEE